jgi:hypothetical protein
MNEKAVGRVGPQRHEKVRKVLPEDDTLARTVQEMRL